MLSRRLNSAALLTAAALVGACAELPEPDATLSSTESELIYGADDRLEFYELSSSVSLSVAASTVALMSNSSLTWDGSAWSIDTSGTFGSAYGLCSSEPFRTQPNPAFCSGFQVGPDLIATAGHCVDAASCATTSFVFGFHMTDASTVRSSVPSDDVYQCSTIVARAETSTLDYAVVRVDRAIVGHDALPLRRDGVVVGGTELEVSGHPAGIPLKVAGGAEVRSNSAADYFEANLDTYGGNSGSPVYDAATGVVEGILVRGNTDFVSVGRGRNRCYVSNECSDAGCPGWEDVTRATRFADFVPVGGCELDSECDDADPCNGFETCVSGACAGGTPAICSDGDACTGDACLALDATTWECSYDPIRCDDGDACTVDFCDSATGCASVPIVCGVGEVCESGTCVAVPECSPRGSTCSSNSECCSNRCHARRGCR